MSFTNITDEELIGKGVTGLPDTPGLSTEDMQAKFDEYSVFLKDKFKTLISELEAVSGALNIGAEVPQNISAEGNIQSILNGLRQYVDDTVIALGTGDMATGIYDPDRDGIISPEQGGTGQASLRAARNAMGLGDTTGALPIANGGTGQITAEGIRGVLGLGNTTGALPIANGGTGASTVVGARNALGLGNTSGALPIANGGTGQTTVASARNALGLGNTEGALPVANGGTGKTSITAGSVLVGNGTSTPTERSIDTTSGGTADSNALITSGAVNSKITEMQSTFQDGVDTIYDAVVAEGVTPSASTPSAIASAVHGLTEITWTENFTIAATWYIGNTVQSQSVVNISADNIISIKATYLSDDVSAANITTYKIYWIDDDGNFIGNEDITVNTVYTVPDSAKTINIRIIKQRDSASTLNNIHIWFTITRQTKILR